MLKRLANSPLRKRWPMIMFIVMGVASTIWFLIRVIPKPSRAAYPCMRTAAPIMSSFVIWLIGITASMAIFRKSGKLLRQARYPMAIALLVAGVTVAAIASFSHPKKASAAAFATEEDFTPNDPQGVAKGIFPGRVVWYWDPDATREASTGTVNGDGIINNNDDVFYLEKNNDEEVIDHMVEQVLLYLTDAGTIPNAWDSIFTYFNRKVNDKEAGYSAGEYVYIKTNNQGIGITLNMNADLSQKDGKVWSSFPPHMTATSPFTIRAVVKQLVDEAGVPEENIYVGDPHNNFNNIYYDILRADFPDLKIIGVNGDKVVDCEAYGRTLSIPGTETVIYYSDKTVITAENDKIYKQFQEADYIINIPAMKSHIRGGVTLFCKNHFGTHTRSSASHLHPGLVSPDGDADNTGYGKYRVLTDLMGNKYLGGKTMLYILDGLWGGPPHELDEPRKWDMAPFNGDWTSSIFASQDPVAIASVAYDFLRTEYNTDDWGDEAYPNYSGTDDYLHQAADASNWPVGVTYDPENDGTPIGSLGTHEHWNNAIDKRYSKNLGTGDGIELLEAHLHPYSVEMKRNASEIAIYPNPASESAVIQMNSQFHGDVNVRIYNLSGQLISHHTVYKPSGRFETSLDISGMLQGVYMINLDEGSNTSTERLVITRR